MNQTCVSNLSDYPYYEPNVMKGNDPLGSPHSALYSSPSHTQNFSDYFKMSIHVGDQFPYDLCTDPVGKPTPRADIQNQLLMYKAQQAAQSRSFDDCTCSSYSSDVPHCTCGVKAEKLTSSFENDMMPTKPNFKATATPDGWLSEWERNRLQPMIVPDSTHEFYETDPYYLINDRSIYETDTAHPVPHINPERSTGFTSYQRVPKGPETTYSAPSPITNSGLKQKSSRPRLCHFLFELLANPAQYSGIIEWVDKDQGVFKFLNSAEVASQWGRRRNKPHMKYENFARSLRTYIAKGILTKPRSKLVYRFTSKVY